MNTVIMDLEWNGVFSRRLHGYFNEIIEIGAVKLDDDQNLMDTFHQVIRPVPGHKLSSLVQGLTGIEEEELQEGISFAQAASLFKQWVTEPDTIIMTWSTTDLMVLLENYRYFLGEDCIPFMKQYADLQAYCQFRLGQRADDAPASQQLGLGKACELLDIAVDELSPHRALDDSLLSAHVFARVFEPQSFERTVSKADRVFYERLSFKTTIISNIEDEHIHSDDLRFRCESCGRHLRRAGDWHFRNRAFYADFWCRSCDQRYIGRVQVKLKYDGPETKKRLIVKPVEEPEGQASDGLPTGDDSAKS